MLRRHPAAAPRPPQQQQQLDLIAGVTSQRDRLQLPGGGLAVTDERQLARRCISRCSSLTRHWQTIVHVIFVVSLLVNASVITVVCWHWNTPCHSGAQPQRPVDHVS